MGHFSNEVNMSGYLFRPEAVHQANEILLKLIRRTLPIEEMIPLLEIMRDLPTEKQTDLIYKFLESKGYRIKLGRRREFAAQVAGFSNFDDSKHFFKDRNQKIPPNPKETLHHIFNIYSANHKSLTALLPKHLPENIRSILSEEFHKMRLQIDTEGSSHALMIVLYMRGSISGSNRIIFSEQEMKDYVFALFIENTLVELDTYGLIENYAGAEDYFYMFNPNRDFDFDFAEEPYKAVESMKAAGLDLQVLLSNWSIMEEFVRR